MLDVLCACLRVRDTHQALHIDVFPESIRSFFRLFYEFFIQESSAFLKSIENQTEKSRPGRVAVLPPQMGLAAATKSKAPEIAGKPGEFIGGWARDPTPGGMPEATQLKDNSRWIEKSMGEGTVLGKTLLDGGNDMPALPATDRLRQLFLFFALVLYCRAKPGFRLARSTVAPPIIGQRRYNTERWQK
jgi:hypothetical protein